MNTKTELNAALRRAILDRPEDVLDDRDMMQALIDSNERRMGANIVDMRGLAMARLETRLDQLEETHRSVIAAAYDNLAGMHQIHRAVLRLLDAADPGDFLAILGDELPGVLRVDAIRLVLEGAGDLPKGFRDGKTLKLEAPGFAEAYLSGAGGRVREITLRTAPPRSHELFDDAGIGSEACIRLDRGPASSVGMLALGARDGTMFTPQQGTDLLAFLGGVVSRSLQRWVP